MTNNPKKNMRIQQQLVMVPAFNRYWLRLSNKKNWVHPKKYKGWVLVATGDHETLRGDIKKRFPNLNLKDDKFIKVKPHMLNNRNSKLTLKRINRMLGTINSKGEGKHSLALLRKDKSVIDALTRSDYGVTANLANDYPWNKKQLRFSNSGTLKVYSALSWAECCLGPS